MDVSEEHAASTFYICGVISQKIEIFKFSNLTGKILFGCKSEPNQ
jgi:hypothetical protein